MTLSNENPNVSVNKEVKEVDIYADIVQYMNNNRSVTLLLYAWKLLGIKNATYAQMTSIDQDGFTLDVKIANLIIECHSLVALQICFKIVKLFMKAIL